MITHRRATRVAPEPPVRFYKIIALSFLIITVLLLATVIFITSKKADIVIVAKEDSKDLSMQASVAPTVTGATVLRGAVSSTAFTWTERYHPTGTKRVEGISRGEVILHNDQNVDQALVRTTQLATPENVIFRIDNAVVIPAQGQIKVSVYADKPGVSGDIGPVAHFIIPKLSEAKQKLVYAESKESMSGGSGVLGVLSDDDIASAKKDYMEKVKAAFEAELPQPLAGAARVVVVAPGQTAAADHKAGDEVSTFSVSGTSTLVVVSYMTEDLNNALDKQIAQSIDSAAEKIVSLDKNPTITVDSFSLKEGTAELSVRVAATVTLDANGDRLAPANFLGKKKDEIERYLMGLNHVSNVSVKFSPPWVFSAPTVPDRIRIVVKHVQ